MTSHALRILVVAEDRRTLRHLSKFLVTFGYRVQEIADWQRALDVLDGAAPDMLIVDSEPDLHAALEFCGSAEGRVRPACVRKFLLVHRPSPRTLIEALEAGVDDFLDKPIVYGQLLARLRAAARSLEFDRRVQQQVGIDPRTRLASRNSFYERVSRISSSGEDHQVPAACVLVDLDCLDRINYLYGRTAGDRVIQAAAAKLNDLCRETDLLSSFGGDKFCIWLPEMSQADALAWAHRVRGNLAGMDLGPGESALRVTASLGVSVYPRHAQTVEEVVDRASSALQMAKTSGRDCVMCYGECDGDAEAWTGFAAPGKLFERTVARDVMTPCLQALRDEDTVDQAAELFHRDQTSAVPVVDADGRLAGVLLRESILSVPPGVELGAFPVRDLLTADVPVCDEETSFASLKDFFTRDSKSLLVIVHADRPTGFVTPGSLAVLSEPLTAESFVPTGPCHSGSAYLRVPDLSSLGDCALSER